MEAADDLSDTISQASLRSRRSIRSMRPAVLPAEGGGAPSPSTPTPTASGAPRAFAAPSASGRRASVRGVGELSVARVAGPGMGDDGVSDASRDVGGLELEGWDEKFVYKVGEVWVGEGVVSAWWLLCLCVCVCVFFLFAV